MNGNLVITCEHGGNEVPQDYNHLFGDAKEALDSHRGWDPGALDMAIALSKKLRAPLFSQTVTRLLIEMNRSLDHYQLFSQYADDLTPSEKETLIHRFYLPYRRPVENYLATLPGPIVHLSIHSFTPVSYGVVRDVDIGLLFDPERRFETLFCEDLLCRLKLRLNDYRILFNEPYRGIDDGFTTYLRTVFGDDRYAGIEIEVNQRHVNTPQWKIIAEALSEAVGNIMT